jgi:hypothetical protein
MLYVVCCIKPSLSMLLTPIKPTSSMLLTPIKPSCTGVIWCGLGLRERQRLLFGSGLRRVTGSVSGADQFQPTGMFHICITIIDTIIDTIYQ